MLRKVVSSNHFRRSINGMNCTERKLVFHTFTEALKQKGIFSSRTIGLKQSAFQRQKSWTRRMRKFYGIFSSHSQSAPPEAVHFTILLLKRKLSQSMWRKQRLDAVCILLFAMKCARECLMTPTCGNGFWWNYLLLIERENFYHYQAVQGLYY